MAKILGPMENNILWHRKRKKLGMGGKKYSLAGGALSAKMKAGGSKCGIGDALTRELHLPSQ